MCANSFRFRFRQVEDCPLLCLFVFYNTRYLFSLKVFYSLRVLLTQCTSCITFASLMYLVSSEPYNPDVNVSSEVAFTAVTKMLLQNMYFNMFFNYYFILTVYIDKLLPGAMNIFIRSISRCRAFQVSRHTHKQHSGGVPLRIFLLVHFYAVSARIVHTSVFINSDVSEGYDHISRQVWPRVDKFEISVDPCCSVVKRRMRRNIRSY